VEDPIFNQLAVVPSSLGRDASPFAADMDVPN
jgi:hypothetical protein